MKISIIVAIADNWLIGNKNKLPWHLPADLKHFQKITLGHHVVMGQNTFLSLDRPLPGRINIVLTKDKSFKAKGGFVVFSVEEALSLARKNKEKEVFIIGGASVYRQTLSLADRIYLTRIHYSFAGDVFFPKINFRKWKLISCQKNLPDGKNHYCFDFCLYERKANFYPKF